LSNNEIRIHKFENEICFFPERRFSTTWIVVLTLEIAFHIRVSLRNETKRAATRVAFIPQMRGGRGAVNATPILKEDLPSSALQTEYSLHIMYFMNGKSLKNHRHYYEKMQTNATKEKEIKEKNRLETA